MFPDVFLAHAAAHFDFSKAAKFGVLIFQPPGLIAGGLLGGLIGQTQLTRSLAPLINTTGLTLQCEQASLPGYTINTVEQKVYGTPFSVAAGPGEMPPLELQFVSMGDMWERKFFEDWMEFIVPKGYARPSAKDFVGTVFQIGPNNSGRAAGSVNYRNEYISTIQVIAFHETGVPAARYTFQECYPVAVAPQALNWGDDGINRVNVTFKYTTWNREQNIIKQIWDQFTRGGTSFGSDLPIIK